MAASPDIDRRDTLVERLFEAVLGFNDLHAVYIGDRRRGRARDVRLVDPPLPPGRAGRAAVSETGTAMRESTFRGYAEEAGFGKVEVVPIEHDFWRFYRLEA